MGKIAFKFLRFILISTKIWLRKIVNFAVWFDPVQIEFRELQISIDYAKYNAKEKEIRNSIKDKLSNRIKISFHRSFPSAPRNLEVHYDTRGLKGEEAFSRALISASCQTFRGLSGVEAEAIYFMPVCDQ